MDDQKKVELQVGDVVQLDPERHLGEKQGFFGGCFMVISELKDFGAQGYISVPGARGDMPGAAYYRANWDEMEYIGKAVWAIVNVDADKQDE